MTDTRWRVGIDIGGTFTDVALVEETTGKLGVVKVPTSPDDFGRSVLDGVREALQKYGIDASSVGLLSHATTVVTNAILEQKGARCALVATRGFRDVLELRRSARPDLYDLFQDAPHILVPRRHRFEITGRIGADATVVTPLEMQEIPRLIEDIRAAKPQAIAVSLLFSFLNPQHERQLGAALRDAFPDIPVYLSSEVLPEIREFERTSTTAVCAYVGPILGAYLDRLSEAVGSLGLPDLYVMGSNGGVFEVSEGIAMPAMVVESGPAAGVVAAALVAEQTGHRDVLSFDMGGTTAKASLIRDAAYETTAEYEVGGSASGSRTMHGTGHPIRVPVIDLAEVSAGGGSIAWVDRAGSLRVGPKSAGAVPGPVCYGRGGTEPTVTDCNLLLGYLDEHSLLGGEMKVDFGKSRTAIETMLAEPLGIDVRTAAAGVIDVVNHEMAEALRIVSVQRGHDPRDFTLSAFGGAGPLHAAALAEELGMSHVLCPPIPGAFSALGLVTSDLRRDYARTFFARTDEARPEDLTEAFEALALEGRAMLDRAGVPAERQDLRFSVDARYTRQSYELAVPVPRDLPAEDVLPAVAAAFHDRHEQTYGHARRDEPVQMVNVRLSAVGRIPPIRVAQATGSGEAEKGTRTVWFRSHGAVEAGVLDRARMAANQTVAGPAIIESLESTILIPPGWTGRMDADGFIHLTLDAGGTA